MDLRAMVAVALLIASACGGAGGSPKGTAPGYPQASGSVPNAAGTDAPKEYPKSTPASDYGY